MSVINNQILESILLSGNGKLKQDSVPINSYNTKTLRLKCTPETNILCLDVDVTKQDGNYIWNKWLNKLIKFIDKDDLISYSDEYTIDDVFNGNCHFKVFYWVDDLGTYTNPKKVKYKEMGIEKDSVWFSSDEIILKDNKGVDFKNKIELLYGNKTTPAIYGKRDDGYQYILSGTLKKLPFILQDVLPYAVKYNKHESEKKKRVNKSTKIDLDRSNDLVTKDNEDSSIVGIEKENVEPADAEEGLELVSVTEFKNIIKLINDKYNTELDLKAIRQENDKLLSFKCLFPHAHSDIKYANAYAFKKNNLYICKCHGIVCGEDYKQLNRRIRSLQDYPDLKGYSEFINGEHSVTMFKAYTGWGKTEKIADGIIEHIKNKTKALIILPNIDNMYSLLNRVYSRLDEHNCSLDPVEDGKIYLHHAETSANYDDESFINLLHNSNVVITHHQYFGLSGDVMSWYPRTKMMMDLILWDEINIDEGHAFLEHSTTHDLELGGLYKKTAYHYEFERYNTAINQLEYDYLVSEQTIGEVTKCCKLKPNNYGQLQFKIQNIIDTRLMDDYVDLLTYIKNNWNMKEKYITEEHHQVELYINPNKQPLMSLDLSDLPTVHANKYQLLTQSASNVILTKTLPHPEKKRKTIGRSIARFSYNDILETIVKSAKQVVFLSGTYYEHHYDILSSVVGDNFNKVNVDEEMSKVKNITVLRNIKDVRNRDNLHNYLDGNSPYNFLYVTQTIANANGLIKRYHNYTHNHNGVYMYTKSPDGIDMKHNVTVFSLESAVSKGYNFTEELYGDGFDAVYFDGRGVSPIVNKLYCINNELVSIEEDYEIGNLSQAVGKMFAPIRSDSNVYKAI